MKKEIVEVYVCDFCGMRHKDEKWMLLHESVCSKNPTNMPCSVCANHIVSFGCAYGIDCNAVGGNILCIKYKNGTPLQISDNNVFKSLPDVFTTIDRSGIILEGNSSEDTDPNDGK